MEFKSDIPIYIQIASDIKEQILNGKIHEGDKLRSIREYSVEYEVSPLTIQRTFQLLDVDQMTYSKKGIGSFVKMGAKEYLQESVVESTVQEFVIKMRNCGLSNSEIINLVEKSISGEGDR